MSKYTLSFQNTVEVPVKFTLKEGRVNKSYSFTLTAKRQPQSVIEQWGKEEVKVKEILIENVSDWSGQTLINDESDKPAEFGNDAFDALLDVQGVAMRCYLSYLAECGAKAKN